MQMGKHHSNFSALIFVHWCVKYIKNTNNCNINGLHYSTAGGNQEIINVFKEKGHSFENCLGTSVYYHRYELTNWLNENYKCQPFPLPLCIEYNNLVI